MPASNPRTHWILIRGLARESRHWGDFPAHLERALLAEGHAARVDAIDLPGSGRYSEMKSPTSIPEMAEFVREKLQEIRRRQREAGETPARDTYLVAISLGGMIVSSWLERWRDELAGCVLINTSFRGYSTFLRRLSPASYGHLFRIAKAESAIERERNVLRMVSNRPELYDQIAHDWATIHLERPVSHENFARQLLAAARYQPKQVAPVVPVLVLGSDKDRMVDPSCSRVIASRWAATFKVHPSAGHDLPLDDAPWVIQQILDWLPERPREEAHL